MSKVETRPLVVGLVAWDLHHAWGGGQVIYRELIRSNPDLEFIYPIESERLWLARPKNCRAIPWSSREITEWMLALSDWGVDIIDVPDWVPVDPSPLLTRSMRNPALVVALHGRLSDTLKFEGLLSRDELQMMRAREDRLLKSADEIYGISRPYLESTSQAIGVDGCLLPGETVRAAIRRLPSLPVKTIEMKEPKRRILVPIGRDQKSKGLNRFLSTIPWLDPDEVDEVIIFGGGDSEELGQRVAGLNPSRLSVRIEPAQCWQEYLQAGSERSVAVFAAEFESFGLAVAEAVQEGLHAVSAQEVLGNVQIATMYPEGDLTVTDFSNPRIAAACINAALHSQTNVARSSDVCVAVVENFGTRSIAEVYEVASKRHPRIETPRPRRSPPGNSRIRSVVIRGKVRVRSTLKSWTTTSKSAALRMRAVLSPETLRMRLRAASANLPRTLISQVASRNAKSVIASGWWGDPIATGDSLRQILRTPFPGRLRVFRYLQLQAQLEGEYQTELAYSLRLHRLLPNELVEISLCKRIRELFVLIGDDEGLRAFDAAASAAESGGNQLFELLEERRRQLLRPPDLEAPQIEQSFGSSKGIRLSIIVSLYNAESEIGDFLDSISQQTLIGTDLLEFVFVDSASPTNERANIFEWAIASGTCVRYLRTSERETIQTAWNRGIAAASGEYLVFLGSDEWLFPSALERMAEFLDSHPDIDWVMGDSSVYEVDTEGQFDRFVMMYDREGFKKWSPLLETCYLSWVGGMYRKVVHNLGWYDGSFRGAGDTEFKNRVLSGLSWCRIPGVLGGFANYPRGTTTASARIEVEDDRAWYLFRTPAGVEWTLREVAEAGLVEILGMCLGYRKSYSTVCSTDIELGMSVARLLATRTNDTNWLKFAQSIELLRDRYARLDWGGDSVTENVQLERAARRQLKVVLKAFESASGASAPRARGIWEDNRFEQHSWGWGPS